MASIVCVLAMILASVALPAEAQYDYTFGPFGFKFNKPEVKAPEIKIPDIKVPDIKIPKISMPDINLPSMPSLPKIDMKKMQDSVMDMYSKFTNMMGMDNLMAKMGGMFSMDKMKSVLSKIGFPSFMYGDVEDMSGKTLTDMGRFLNYKLENMKDEVQNKVSSAVDKVNSKMQGAANSLNSGFSKLKSAISRVTG